MRDADRIAALALPPDKRDGKAEADNVERLRAMEARIAELDAILSRQYKRFATPTPLSVEEVQAKYLGPDEALVLFLDTPEWKPAPEETFIWVVTKTSMRWVRVALGTGALTEEVKALRCGLDEKGAWTDGSCGKLLGVKYGVLEKYYFNKPLPFDVDRAHKLYQVLFDQIEDLIGDKKHLLLVPSGPLTALPFQVLVTKKPDDVAAIPASDADFGKLTWLGQTKAMTVLPSVSSLKALRRDANPSAGTIPYIAFANPLLSGPDGKDRRAWGKQDCPAPAKVKAEDFAFLPGPSSLRGLAAAEDVRHQDPLPETADEVCAVARLLGADPSRDVYLGGRATKAQVQTLSDDGTLTKARVVHFATHGLLAKETGDILKTASGQAQLVSMPANNLPLTGASQKPRTVHPEAALILTPPETASDDNGLLTASDVAALKLDADWVVLSACNTAAPGAATGTEALSGLARAFFYAGARALLVSHWYVNSIVTVPLITRAFRELEARPEIGRAEAMRLAMSSIIAEGGRKAHPTSWAPFVVVGEGGATN